MDSHPAMAPGVLFHLRSHQGGLEQQAGLQDADWYDAFLERQNGANVPKSGLDRLAQCIRFHLTAAFGVRGLAQSAGLKPSHDLNHSPSRWGNVGICMPLVDFDCSTFACHVWIPATVSGSVQGTCSLSQAVP